MKNDDDLTLIRELIALDGNVLVWRPRTPTGTASQQHIVKLWNMKCAGKPVHMDIHYKGYARVRFRGWRRFFAHHVVWALYHGAWPQDQIDHINGDKTDNRIENLREVSAAENCRNKPLHKRNRTGVSGVRPVAAGFAALIGGGLQGRPIHLGTFPTFEAAVAARRKAERRLGYHENHGRRA